MRIVRYRLRFRFLPDRWQMVIRLGYAFGPAGVLSAVGVLVPARETPALTAAIAVTTSAATSAATHPSRSLENCSILF
jgi:hypothetical protein